MEGKILRDRIDTSINLGLNRVLEALSILGIDSIANRVVIVAGTNGKGSTLSYLEGMLLSFGFRVFSYLSPHVLSFSERVRINGIYLEEGFIEETYRLVEDRLKDRWKTLTPFERFTVTAFYIATFGKFDFALLEVGLGGRLDATNVFDNDYAVITSIGFDHMEFLGNSLEEIAFEKAHVIKNGTFTVIGDVSDSVFEVVSSVARRNGSILRRVGVDFRYLVTDCSFGNVDFIYDGLYVKERKLSLNTFNSVFAHNFSLALYLFENIVGREVERIDLTNVIERFNLPGRCEVLRLGDSTLVLDVAHNYHALNRLKGDIERTCGNVTWFISPVKGKDWYRILGEIRGKVFLLENPEKGYTEDELKEFGSVVTLDESMEMLREGGLYVFTGSFYIVRELKRRLKYG